MDQYTVTGMSCAACQARVEKAVSKVEGVDSCNVSLLTNTLAVEGTASSEAIMQAVENAGYGAAPKVASVGSAGGSGTGAGGSLSAKLAASDKFILLERSDLELINTEQELAGISSKVVGADYLIIGSLTKNGRKNTGESDVFSRTKRQTVSVVDRIIEQFITGRTVIRIIGNHAVFIGSKHP